MPRFFESRDLDDELFLQECYRRLNGNLGILLHESVLCGICLEKHMNLYQMNFEDVTKTGGSFTPERMLLDIFDIKVIQTLPCAYICNKCQEHVRQNYVFRCRVKNSWKILNNYIEQMNNQIQDIESYAESVLSINEEVSNTVIILQELVKIEKDNIINVKTKPDQQNIFACDFCSNKFSTEAAVKKHIRNLHYKAKKMQNCVECHQRPCVHEKYLVSQSEQRAKGLTNIKCPDCEYTSKNGTYCLIDHVNRHHLNLKPHMCKICGTTFHTKKSYVNHKQICPSKICAYCGQQFKTLEIKENHEMNCKTISRPFECEWCPGSTFKTQKIVRRHRRQIHKQLKCSKCTTTCIDVDAMKTHMLFAHKNAKPNYVPPRRVVPNYDCILCPKKFKSTKDLTVHQTNAHKPDEKYKCKLCHREVSDRKLYLRHVTKHDPNAKYSFKCDQCSFSTVSSMVLEHHVNSVHLQIRPYVCDTCGKAFTNTHYLRIHLQTHDAQRRAQCPHCTMKMSCTASLERHILRRHSATRPFVCGECGTQFATKTDLLLHKTRKHGGTKRHSCPLCGGKHSMLGELRAHISRVHAKGILLSDFLDAEGENYPQLLEIFRDRFPKRGILASYLHEGSVTNAMSHSSNIDAINQDS